MAKIAVDPGHGTNTPGKRTAKKVPKYGRVIKEYEFNKPTAKYLKAALERQGHTVTYTGGDSDPSLSSRCAKANNAKVDLFISIHYNAGGGHGVETYVIARGGKAEKLAKKVQTNLVKVRKQRDRGVKVANFQVLRDTKMPAILCECGFMDDPRGIEQSWMLDKAFQKDVAEAICKGVQEHLGKTYKAPSGSKPAPKPSKDKWTKEQQEQISRLNPAPKPAGTKFTRTLKYVAGNQMEGNDVLAVQYKIGVKPYKDDKTGKVIGTFGPLTRDALKAWQKKNGIKETGEVGIVNWRKMFGEKKEEPKPAPKPQPKDTVHRVIVDGKQVGAYGVNKNAANAVEQALDKGAKKINVEEAK